MKAVVGHGNKDLKRKSSSRNSAKRSAKPKRKRQKKGHGATSSCSGSDYNAFRNATRLHLANYTKDQFFKYHDKYDMQRKRARGDGKWLYTVIIGGELEHGGSLKEVMDKCFAVEQTSAVSTLASNFGTNSE